jgi:hypothetical protein
MPVKLEATSGEHPKIGNSELKHDQLGGQAKERTKDPSGREHGGTVVAKEGSTYLVVSTSGLMAGSLDSEKDYTYKYDDENCKTKLAPVAHYNKLLNLVATARESKTTKDIKCNFEKGLAEVYISNDFGRSRAVWRLVFDSGDYKGALNCGKVNQKEISKKLGIESFHDLLEGPQAQNIVAPAPTVQTQKIIEDVPQPDKAAPPPVHQAEDAIYIDSTPANGSVPDVTKESKDVEKPDGMADHTKLYNERQEFIAKTGKVIIAEARRGNESGYVLVQYADKVCVLEETVDTDQYEYSFGTENIFAPRSHLHLLLKLAETGLDSFRRGVKKVRYAENNSSRSDLDVWLFQTCSYEAELRCNLATGAELLRKLKIVDFKTLMERCNTSPQQSKPLPTTRQRDAPIRSRRTSPHTPLAMDDSVLPSTEIVAPMVNGTTENAPVKFYTPCPNRGEYHVIATHLPQKSQRYPESGTYCIVKVNDPSEYRLWIWSQVQDMGSSVKSHAIEPQFHQPDLEALEHIGKNMGGFKAIGHKVITMLTRQYTNKFFANTVIVSIENKEKWLEILEKRTDGNTGPLRCSRTEFVKRGGKYADANAKIQLDTQAGQEYSLYLDKKAKNKNTRSMSRELTPVEVDLIREHSRELSNELTVGIKDLSMRIADVENKLARSQL